MVPTWEALLCAFMDNKLAKLIGRGRKGEREGGREGEKEIERGRGGGRGRERGGGRKERKGRGGEAFTSN